MAKGMDRRDFLKYSLATGAILAAGSPFTGSAHRGIVNTVKQAQKVAGTDKIHAVLGGFHLIGAEPEIIENTVADIKAMNPDILAF